jgi:hypothetical protein
MNSIPHLRSTDKPVFLEIIAQEQVFKASLKGLPPVGGGKRGKVKEFSRASRKRLIDLLNRVPFSPQKGAPWATLTYPGRFPSPLESTVHFKRFEERIKYMYSDVSIVWRKELQARGAPHFHCLLLNAPFINKHKLCAIWMECIIEYLSLSQVAALNNWRVSNREIPKELRVFTRIEWIRSWKQLTCYVSKYMAKLPEAPRIDGVHGACEYTPSVSGAPDGASGFNYGTYSQEGEGEGEKEGKNLGRSWGIFNRKALPKSEPLVIRLPWDHCQVGHRVLLKLKRVYREIYRSLLGEKLKDRPENEAVRKWFGHAFYGADSGFTVYGDRMKVLKGFELALMFCQSDVGA